MKITFERYEKQGKHGDRATKLTDYYSYEIKLHKDVPQQWLDTPGYKPGYMVVARFSGYDGWQESIRNREDVRTEAENFVNDLAEVMGMPVPDMINMVRKVTTTEEWVAEENPGDE